MATDFNLPAVSFEELQKIIKGYGNLPENSNLEALAKLIGLDSSEMSRNSKFLSDIGLIVGTTTKTATDLGRKLGRALEHKQAVDAQRYWKEAVQTNEPMANLVTTLRIQGPMSEKDFSEHVLYVSGHKNDPRGKTGSRCVVDVLVAAGLIEEAGGNLTVATPSATGSEEPEKLATAAPQMPTPGPWPSAQSQLSPATPVAPAEPQVSIHIELHLPETENAEVYVKLFKALREHLLSPKG